MNLSTLVLGIACVILLSVVYFANKTNRKLNEQLKSARWILQTIQSNHSGHLKCLMGKPQRFYAYHSLSWQNRVDVLAEYVINNGETQIILLKSFDDPDQEFNLLLAEELVDKLNEQ